MAFTCVLYLKEECDGCGACEEEGFLPAPRVRYGTDMPDNPYDDMMDREE